MSRLHHRALLPEMASLIVVLTVLLAIPSSYSTPICGPEPLFLQLDYCNITIPATAGQTATHIYSWGALVGIAPPNSDAASPGSVQTICVVPSTVANTTLLLTDDVCSQAQLPNKTTVSQCLSRRGGTINPSLLQMATAAELSTVENLNPNWPLVQDPGSKAFPAAVWGDVRLRDGSENDADNVLMGLVESGTNHTAHQLGLAEASTLLATLVKLGRIPRRAFGLDAGSTSPHSPRPGSLILGGYDAARSVGKWDDFPIRGFNTTIGNRFCPFQVKLSSITVRLPTRDGGSQDIPLIRPDNAQLACIEVYDNLFRLPHSAYDIFEYNVKAATSSNLRSNDSKSLDPNIYVAESGFGYPVGNDSALLDGASLMVTLDRGTGNPFVVEIPPEEFVRPLSGFAKNGSRVVNENFREIQIFKDSDAVNLGEAVVLGKVFLSMVYLYAQFDGQERFWLSQISSSSYGSIPRIYGAGEGCGAFAPDSSSTSTWKPVAIGALAIAIFAAVAVLACVIYRIVKKRQDSRAAAKPTAEGADDAPDPSRDDAAAAAKESPVTHAVLPVRDSSSTSPDPPPSSTGHLAGTNPLLRTETATTVFTHQSSNAPFAAAAAGDPPISPASNAPQVNILDHRYSNKEVINEMQGMSFRVDPTSPIEKPASPVGSRPAAGDVVGAHASDPALHHDSVIPPASATLFGPPVFQPMSADDAGVGAQARRHERSNSEVSAMDPGH